MTPRQARRERRAAERKTKKAEIRRTQADLLANPEPRFSAPQVSLAEDTAAAPAALGNGFVSHNASTPASRAEINRANARLSTGPRTHAGKAASSRNSTKHGLASGQLIIPGEDPSAYEAFLADLLHEHEPADSTEELLVNRITQSYWLEQRAIRLQNSCFTETGVDEKSLSLFLRYGTTHNRAFHKALTDLHRLQKERRKAKHAQQSPERGFVSHSTSKMAVSPQFVRQNEPSGELESGFVSQNEPAEPLERNHSASKVA